MPKTTSRAANDKRILALLGAGTLTVDPAIGRIMVAGKEPAIQITKDGYLRTQVGRHGFMQHRVIYLAVHGDFGDLDINHRNGNPADNRIDNLEAVSKSQNNYHRTRNCQYLGTFPDEDARVSDEFMAAAQALAARGDATRADVLALLGKADQEDEISPLYRRGPGHRIVA